MFCEGVGKGDFQTLIVADDALFWHGNSPYSAFIVVGVISVCQRTAWDWMSTMQSTAHWLQGASGPVLCPTPRRRKPKSGRETRREPILNCFDEAEPTRCLEVGILEIKQYRFQPGWNTLRTQKVATRALFKKEAFYGEHPFCGELTPLMCLDLANFTLNLLVGYSSTNEAWV